MSSTPNPDPFTDPDVIAWLSLQERCIFAGSIISFVAYGIHIAVFTQTVYYMINSRKTRKISWPYLTFVCALFTLGTMNIGTSAKILELQFITHRDYPGGPIVWLDVVGVKHPANDISHASYIISNFLADGILVLRLWIVWGKNYFIALIPFLGFIASTTLSILTVLQISFPDRYMISSVDLAVPYAALTMSLNVLITAAIAFRLFTMRKKVASAVGEREARTYAMIAAIIIESAAMYSLLAFIFLVLAVEKSTGNHVVLPLQSQVVCIAPELIILRVSRGQSWTEKTTGPILSTFEVREGTFAESTDSTGVRTTSSSGPRFGNRSKENVIGRDENNDSFDGKEERFEDV